MILFFIGVLFAIDAILFWFIQKLADALIETQTQLNDTIEREIKRNVKAQS